MVALLTIKRDDPAKIIKRQSATATATTTALELEQQETGQLQEANLAQKAYVTQILCLVVIALQTVLFYKERTWLEHASELVKTFTIEKLMIWFGLSFGWPDFGFPAIQVTFTSTFVIMCLTVVGSYLIHALLECAGEPWFAMPDATPGVLEDRLVAAFSSLRLVRGGGCVSEGSCVCGGHCEWVVRGGNCSFWRDTFHSHRA